MPSRHRRRRRGVLSDPEDRAFWNECYIQDQKSRINAKHIIVAQQNGYPIEDEEGLENMVPFPEELHYTLELLDVFIEGGIWEQDQEDPEY